MLMLAKDGMRTDLERIWRMCFDDPADYVRYFFDNKYNPNTCAVYVDENIGRPVAMLHMIEGYITEDSEIIPVQYIYAAATRPDYQRRGIMGQLLEFARRCAEARGQRYQILVPGSRELFKFYEKQGFYRCFKVRKVYMTRDDLKILASKKRNPASVVREKRAAPLTLNDIHAVRHDMLVDREGFVTWDMRALKYAAGAFECSGGRIITACSSTDAGYAFCYAEEGTVHITELIASTGFTAKIIRRILKVFEGDKFELTLPVYNEFFEKFGEIADFGMIRAVNGRYPINLLTVSGLHLPYLGLALD